MSANVTTIETTRQQQPSILNAMASRFTMDPRRFEQTLRATVFPANGTPEQFAAFLLVARQYDLNPITKEIYAFPGKGGSVVPIVSIDGWLKLINSHPQFDGMEFDDTHDDKGELVSVTCKLWRKDRAKPVVVTEYLAECFRPTEPWKMKHRMLRHKTLIQCARYAFGFAGVYDPDEGERIVIAQGGDVSQATAPRSMPTPPTPPPAPQKAIAAPVKSAAEIDFDGLRSALQCATDLDSANAIFDEWMLPREQNMSADEVDEAGAVLREMCEPYFRDAAQ